MTKQNQTIIEVSDQINKSWILFDATAKKWSFNELGFYQLTFTLKRNWQYAWRDFALNNLVTVWSKTKKIKWQGRLETIELNYSKKSPYVIVTCAGYQSHLSDTYFHSSIPAGSVESQIQWPIANNYLPYLKQDYSNILVTGAINNTYTTGNGGTDDETWLKILKNVTKDKLSDGSTVQIQIWNDRTVTTYHVPPASSSTAVSYIVDLEDVKSLGLRRSLLSSENHVRTRYKDFNGVVQYDDAPDTATQAALGKNFGSGIINFVRMRLNDLTNLKNQTATSAATSGANLLKTSKLIKNDSKNIVLNAGARIFNVSTKQWENANEIKTARFILVRNIFTRQSLTGSGTAAGDIGLQEIFYITKMDYNEDSDETTLTPESASALKDVVN